MEAISWFRDHSVATPWNGSWKGVSGGLKIGFATRYGRMSPPLPHPVMARFLTVKEAAQLTGKSPSSIRRVIYPIIHDDKHADREHIHPSTEDAMQLRMKGENFAWRLSEELLRREIPIDTSHEQTSTNTATKPAGHGESDLLGMLRRELDIKNQQIAQQGELIAKHVDLINGLNERLREGNILIGSLQQRLTLTDGRGVHAAETTPERSPSKSAEKGSTMTSKPAKPKKRFLSRFFG
jgi:hypothetical protein